VVPVACKQANNRQLITAIELTRTRKKVKTEMKVEYLKKTVRFRTKLPKNTNRKQHTIYRLIPLSMTLSEL